MLYIKTVIILLKSLKINNNIGVNMKKVLLTATVQSHIYQFHKPLISLLKENNYQVHVAAYNNLSEKGNMKLDFVDKVYNIDFVRSPYSTQNIKAYKQMKKILNENKYEFIHCNTPIGGIVTRLAARNARKNNTKVFYTAHGFHFYKNGPKLNWAIYYPVEKFMTQFTDKLITITTEDYKLALKKFNTDVCYMHGVGVDVNRFKIMSKEEKDSIRNDLGITKEAPVLLCVGELLKNKNQKTIIKAMPKILKSFPNCKLLLAGNGPNEKFLKNLVQDLNLEDSVIFLGYCLDLEKYENICNVLVSCSYREGLPLNIMEAMLCKKPVVASINRGHNDLVIENETGFLFPPDDDTLLAKKVTTLLNDKNLQNKMGEKGYEAVQCFTDKNIKKELKEIYEL